MASILGGELVHRLGGRADALKLYVGGLPEKPMPPFHYQLVFSVEGLINEYVEPARILRKGKLTTIEALTEPEEFHMDGFARWWPFKPPAELPPCPKPSREKWASASRKPCAILATTTCCAN